MSILQSFDLPNNEMNEHLEADDRHARDCLADIKHGFDLLFGFKEKLDKLHPAASEILYRVMHF